MSEHTDAARLEATRDAIRTGTAPRPRVEGEAVAVLIRKAHDEVGRICNERWNGDVGWRTTIPARPGYDTDLIICDALNAAESELARLTAEVERLRGVAVDILDAYHDTKVAPFNEAQYRQYLAALALPTPAPEAKE